MEYAILLHFDRNSETRVLELWNEACKCGGNPDLIDSALRPHITLAVFEDTDIIMFCNKLELFSKQVKKLSLKLGSIGTFAGVQGVVYLAPVMTDELFKLHKEFYKFFDGELSAVSNYYIPNNWVPHCSISINNSIEASISIIKRIIEIYNPLDVEISEISIIECKPDCREIRNFEIK